MLADDIELYFPKLGTRSGKAAFAAFVERVSAQIDSLQH